MTAIFLKSNGSATKPVNSDRFESPSRSIQPLWPSPFPRKKLRHHYWPQHRQRILPTGRKNHKQNKSSYKFCRYMDSSTPLKSIPVFIWHPEIQQEPSVDPKNTSGPFQRQHPMLEGQQQNHVQNEQHLSPTHLCSKSMPELKPTTGCQCKGQIGPAMEMLGGIENKRKCEYTKGKGPKHDCHDYFSLKQLLSSDSAQCI